jgi:hypothetical protein
MFQFNFYDIQEFLGSADEPFICKLILAFVGSGLGAVFGYLLGLRQARILRQNDLKLELQRTKKDDEIFINYCFELIRQSGRVSNQILYNLIDFRNRINPNNTNVLNEAATLNAERFSKIDHARFNALLQSNNPVITLHTQPKTNQIFRLINHIDFIPGGQASALRNVLSENERIGMLNREIKETHRKLDKLIGDTKMAEVLSPELGIERGALNNMNIPELLQNVINPIETKLTSEANWLIPESQATAKTLIRILKEAVSNTNDINAALQTNITVRLEMFENATAEIDNFLRNISQNKATSQVRDFRNASSD